MFLKKLIKKIKCKIACCYKSSCSLNDDLEDIENNQYHEKKISS